MDPDKHYFDRRCTDLCVFCGGAPETKDHVPSKILLDKPFPNNLPVVQCCLECNSGFSLDEEYVACFLECVIEGSTNPDNLRRKKIAQILRDKPSLAKRIADSEVTNSEGEQSWVTEQDRINVVIMKLARGHLDFELSIQRFDDPLSIAAIPVSLMSDEEVDRFDRPQLMHLFPEIGSRAFLRGKGFTKKPITDEWQIVQAGRYEYQVSQASGNIVRILLSDYLACEIRWD